MSKFYIWNQDRYQIKIRQLLEINVQFYFEITERNQPITLALVDEVIDYISWITREWIKTICLIWYQGSVTYNALKKYCE